MMPPVKNPCIMTSYGGITRIRLKGRSLITSSQPANTSSPVLIFYYYTSAFAKIQAIFKKQGSANHMTEKPCYKATTSEL